MSWSVDFAAQLNLDSIDHHTLPGLDCKIAGASQGLLPMITERLKIHGVIREGVIVPDAPLTLPEGTEVEISFLPTKLPQELQDDFDAWDRASDDAWALITEWEQKAQSCNLATSTG